LVGQVKPTKVLTLLGWVIPAAIAGYLFAKYVVASGGQVPVAPLNLILTFLAIAAILAIFAAPMFRYRKELAQQRKDPAAPRPKRLNPFYAVRLVFLAKATAIAGSLFSGWQAGVIWFQISSPVTPGSVWQNVVAFIAAIIMAVVALIIERICRITEDVSNKDSPNESQVAA
jgi:large-conductance mechanosensitive channel